MIRRSLLNLAAALLAGVALPRKSDLTPEPDRVASFEPTCDDCICIPPGPSGEDDRPIYLAVKTMTVHFESGKSAIYISEIGGRTDLPPIFKSTVE